MRKAAKEVAVKPLTKRQVQAVELISQGMKTKQIGQELGITDRTAETTLVQARRRVGAKTLAHLVAMSIRNGWIK